MSAWCALALAQCAHLCAFVRAYFQQRCAHTSVWSARFNWKICMLAYATLLCWVHIHLFLFNDVLVEHIGSFLINWLMRIEFSNARIQCDWMRIGLPSNERCAHCSCELMCCHVNDCNVFMWSIQPHRKMCPFSLEMCAHSALLSVVVN